MSGGGYEAGQLSLAAQWFAKQFSVLPPHAVCPRQGSRGLSGSPRAGPSGARERETNPTQQTTCFVLRTIATMCKPSRVSNPHNGHPRSTHGSLSHEEGAIQNGGSAQPLEPHIAANDSARQVLLAAEPTAS